MKRNGVRLQLIQQPLLTAAAHESNLGVIVFTGGVPGRRGALLWWALALCNPGAGTASCIAVFQFSHWQRWEGGVVVSCR